MTVFGYTDGSAEVYEETLPYMVFGSVAEAVLALNNIQSEYDKALEESRRIFSNKQVEVSKNEFLFVYGLKSDDYEKKKNGQTIISEVLSAFAPEPGLEPGTL